MTDLLKKAIEEASKLADAEQDSLARLLLEEIESEQKWDRAFSDSTNRLSELADEAMEEHGSGKTDELEPENL